MKKVGFIGYGNMASAMAKGFKNKLYDLEIFGCAKNFESLKTRANGVITPFEDAYDVIKNSDIVVISVKPYMVYEICEKYKDILKDKIVVSVAVGVKFSDYEKMLLKGTSHISILPNVPVEVNEGIMICEKTHSLKEGELKEFVEIFSSLGIVEFVEDREFSVAGTIAGCGPAFCAMFIEALSDAGVKYGLRRELSYRLASQMILGTGKLQIEKDILPSKIKDSVTSPGGTTIKGVCGLEESGFRNAVIKAINKIEG